MSDLREKVVEFFLLISLFPDGLVCIVRVSHYPQAVITVSYLQKPGIRISLLSLVREARSLTLDGSHLSLHDCMVSKQALTYRPLAQPLLLLRFLSGDPEVC